MNYLSFVYIRSYRALKEIGLSFEANFKFIVSDNGHKIEIEDCKSLPENFWGEKIETVTAIVGNNGAGKSTAIEFLLNGTVEGLRTIENNGVLIYRQGTNFYYVSDEEVEVLYLGEPVQKSEDKISISAFNYSGHFRVFSNMFDTQNSEMAGQYNGSDGWLLVKDLLSYTNTDTYHLTGRLQNQIFGYIAEDRYRIGRLLCQQQFRDALSDYNLPAYLIVKHNEAGVRKLLESQPHLPNYVTLPPNVQFGEDLWMINYIHHSLINLIVEERAEEDLLVRILTSWHTGIANNQDAESWFEHVILDLVPKESACWDVVRQLIDVKNQLKDLCCYDYNSQLYYVDISQGGDDTLNKIDMLTRGNGFLYARYFDLDYSQELSSNTKLSSGEEELLKLTSRLYDAIITKPEKFGNIETTALLLLDEAEIGFHPEWQMSYVEMLTNFLNAMPIAKGFKFQVVLSTHSPIILSDIPRCCTNYLQRREKFSVNVSDCQPETFGANVFDLYRNAFFMNSGLVGSFARNRIRTIQSRIEAGENWESLEKEILMIGDSYVQMCLIRMYEDRNKTKESKDVLKDFYRSQLRALGEKI